jgi:hypothetical protein
MEKMSSRRGRHKKWIHNFLIEELKGREYWEDIGLTGG